MRAIKRSCMTHVAQELSHVEPHDYLSHVAHASCAFSQRFRCFRQSSGQYILIYQFETPQKIK